MRLKVINRESPDTEPRSIRRERRLWYVSSGNTMPIGCGSCADQDVCGGLRIGEKIFDCASFCRCAATTSCDSICKARPDHFVGRVSEIGGFSLSNVPRCESVEYPPITDYLPLLMHGSRRMAPLKCGAVAIPLAALLDRNDGSRRFGSHDDLCDYFKISTETAIVASGTDEDKSIERVWGLTDIEAFAGALRAIGVVAVTSPNFSLFTDVPRWDNLYNIKRIALGWQQLQAAGLFTPIHVNARTDRDWQRWTEFIGERSEIRAISFEFGTGAGYPLREGWHTEQLCGLARSVQRPLDLYVRGGLMSLPALREAFARIKLIDSRPFMKAINRQSARILEDGALTWEAAPTVYGQELDDLLALNIASCQLDTLQRRRNKSHQTISDRGK